MILGNRAVVSIIAVASLLLASFLYFYKAKSSAAADPEIVNLITEAETMVQRMTVPPKEYVGKNTSLPESVKRQMYEQNMRNVDRLFSGNYKKAMIDIVNHHFSRPFAHNCVDGGVTKVTILGSTKTENGVKVQAEVHKYLVHREQRDGRLVDVRLDGKGTYEYTLEKTAEGWKIVNISGGPDLDASRITVTPVQ
ncbi:hypothetical protein [Ammonifex thiophilus]|uniref:Uncharacterized protein n=2 Tax=Thermoanaerobacteraceae TaxID=186814 RepID=A0A3D8P470_9THEO|nr:hypothetical protein [Ammonifex thiophilus]RDV82051.1 hypothetical protein DXX99_08335 [Ammonifex thiophilus]